MRKLRRGSTSRRNLFSSLVLTLAGFSLAACVSHSARLKPQEEGARPMKGPRGQPQPEVWFSGSPEAAFTAAQKSGKLVFLYWGAVWCPPCNELKSNIFSKPRFSELMQAFVPVYLDGDTEEAQTWGEKLQISGYPTILVLDSQQKELFRLNSSVSLAEFEVALQSLAGQSQSLALVLKQLERRDESVQLTAAEWKLLAFTDWEQLPSRSREERWQLLEKATRLCPENLSMPKALLAASLLSLSTELAESSSQTPEVQTLQTKVRAAAPFYLDLIFKENAGPLRVFINNKAGSIVAWLHPKAQGSDYESLKKKWLSAAARIASLEEASIDTRLWAVYPRLEFFKAERPKEAVPAELKKEVQTAVELADRQATQPFDRHAVISGAAFLLRKVQDYERAEELLKAEAARSDTPWYYYSSLAALEQERERKKEAQNWAALARQSAEGRASKIQWITSDILMNAKPQEPQEKAYLLSLASEYYELATMLSDGFVGRNRARAKKIEEALKSLSQDPEFTRVFKKFEARCAQLLGDNQKNCRQHFQSLERPSE